MHDKCYEIGHIKLNCIQIEPSAAATHTIIWLHGLGADGHDFAPIIPELSLPQSLGVRFIFPHAPIMPVTLNQGYEMRAWFDIYDTSITARIDEQGIDQSVSLLSNIIATQVKEGIPAHRIILAGFSQGAVITLATGLCFPDPLAGIIALSGYLPNADKWLHAASEANRHTPFFIAHGTADPIVPFALGSATNQALTAAGYPVNWHAYNMAHSVCAEEISDIGTWIAKQLVKNK